MGPRTSRFSWVRNGRPMPACSSRASQRASLRFHPLPLPTNGPPGAACPVSTGCIEYVLYNMRWRSKDAVGEQRRHAQRTESTYTICNTRASCRAKWIGHRRHGSSRLLFSLVNKSSISTEQSSIAMTATLVRSGSAYD